MSRSRFYPGSRRSDWEDRRARLRAAAARDDFPVAMVEYDDAAIGVERAGARTLLVESEWRAAWDARTSHHRRPRRTIRWWHRMWRRSGLLATATQQELNRIIGQVDDLIFRSHAELLLIRLIRIDE